jgi:hypothetical protein
MGIQQSSGDESHATLIVFQIEPRGAGDLTSFFLYSQTHKVVRTEIALRAAADSSVLPVIFVSTRQSRKAIVGLRRLLGVRKGSAVFIGVDCATISDASQTQFIGKYLDFVVVPPLARKWLSAIKRTRFYASTGKAPFAIFFAKNEVMRKQIAASALEHFSLLTTPDGWILPYVRTQRALALVMIDLALSADIVKHILAYRELFFPKARIIGIFRVGHSLSENVARLKGVLNAQLVDVQVSPATMKNLMFSLARAADKIS